MENKICRDADDAAQQACLLLSRRINAAVNQRGRACIGVSGGHTPWTMLRKLAECDLPWTKLDIFQVDERQCPETSNYRNYKHLKYILPSDSRMHPMPVEDADHGAERYAAELSEFSGSPPILDVVHLGLGPDGHTASLVPGDPVLNVTDRDVAWTQPYQGHSRMTLTYPALDRARCVFWLVTGTSKRDALARLMDDDVAIPAARIRTPERLIIADRDAVAKPQA